jgi:hypothetical protein
VFWLGKLLVLTEGLIGLALIRRRVQLRWPSLRNRHFDVATVVLLLLGLGIMAIIHVREVRKSEELEGTVSVLRDFLSVGPMGPTGITGMTGAGQGDPDWERHAPSAVEIFDKAKTLAAHYSSYDQARDELSKYLSTRPL